MPDELHQPTGPTVFQPDWAAYYQYTLGRETRPLFRKGAAAVASAGVRPGQAIEIGFGDGTETLALLADGWRVLAVDPMPEAAEMLRGRVLEAHAARLEILTASASAVDLPSFDLIYAGYALSFLEPSAFHRFWIGVRDRLRPGGLIVVNIFGVKDSWARDPMMTFLDLAEVRRLVAGLEIVAIDEEDADGDSFAGRKHWNLFDIVARRSAVDAG